MSNNNNNDNNNPNAGWQGDPGDIRGIENFRQGEKFKRQIEGKKTASELAKEKAAKKLAMDKLGKRFSDRAKSLKKSHAPKKTFSDKIPASPTH